MTSRHHSPRPPISGGHIAPRSTSTRGLSEPPRCSDSTNTTRMMAARISVTGHDSSDRRWSRLLFGDGSRLPLHRRSLPPPGTGARQRDRPAASAWCCAARRIAGLVVSRADVRSWSRHASSSSARGARRDGPPVRACVAAEPCQRASEKLLDLLCATGECQQDEAGLLALQTAQRRLRLTPRGGHLVEPAELAIGPDLGGADRHALVAVGSEVASAFPASRHGP